MQLDGGLRSRPEHRISPTASVLLSDILVAIERIINWTKSSSWLKRDITSISNLTRN
jgi:hypothetical protein